MTFRQIRAKIRLWWYFRNRKCYVCGRSGNEELKNRDVIVWPCTEHAKQVSDNLRDLTATFRIGDHVRVIVGVGCFNAGSKCKVVHHRGFLKYEIESLDMYFDDDGTPYRTDVEEKHIVRMS